MHTFQSIISVCKLYIVEVHWHMARLPYPWASLTDLYAKEVATDVYGGAHTFFTRNTTET